MEGTKALKLDSSFRPVDIIDAVEALVLCLVGKAKSIETHTREIRTVKDSFKLPSVIVLTRYVKFRFTTMVCNRTNVLWRDQSKCQYCGNHFRTDLLTLDHVIPKSRGGKNTWKNLVTACKKCNQRKGNKTPEESGMLPIRKPFKPKVSLLKSLNKEQINPKWKIYLWETV
tara:strand:- start:340 stop:852 length:513 start_codon:yes stop_codon:yes gene_type:complete